MNVVNENNISKLEDDGLDTVVDAARTFYSSDHADVKTYLESDPEGIVQLYGAVMSRILDRVDEENHSLQLFIEDGNPIWDYDNHCVAVHICMEEIGEEMRNGQDISDDLMTKTATAITYGLLASHKESSLLDDWEVKFYRGATMPDNVGYHLVRR